MVLEPFEGGGFLAKSETNRNGLVTDVDGWPCVATGPIYGSWRLPRAHGKFVASHLHDAQPGRGASYSNCPSGFIG